MDPPASGNASTLTPPRMPLLKSHRPMDWTGGWTEGLDGYERERTDGTELTDRWTEEMGPAPRAGPMGITR